MSNFYSADKINGYDRRYNSNESCMKIRELDSKNMLGHLVRHGYRHAGDNGLLLNVSPAQSGEFFLQGVPYRLAEGRVIVLHQGTVEIEIDMRLHTLGAGDLALLLPDTLVLVTSISADACASAFLFRQMPQLQGTMESFVVSDDSVAFARANQYLTMIFEQFNRNTVFTDIISHFFDALILDMLSLRPEEKLSHGGEFMRRFRHLLTKEGRTKHSISFYADRLCVSPNHMSALVKRESGLTVLQWIDRALVREAKVLLHHTPMPVAEVAETLGFATPSFFIRFFRQQTGQTPLQYRKASL